MKILPAPRPARQPRPIPAGMPAFLLLLALSAPASGAEAPVSYHKDVVPILVRSCQGCHNAAKADGGLDLSTYAAFKKGGDTGPAFEPGAPADSFTMTRIAGPKPTMPKKADPLPKSETDLIARWIAEGAVDDTPAEVPTGPLKPTLYTAPPVISAMALSPAGDHLAVSGHHEILIHKPDGTGLEQRLQGPAPRIDALAYSPDGKRLAAAASHPARSGVIEIWDPAGPALIATHKLSSDSLPGLAWSPDGTLIAAGGVDKSLRVVEAATGEVKVKFDAHTDWILSAMFSADGKRTLSASRDMAMKLVNLENGQFIDDVNKLLEGVLCATRHPSMDLAAYGGALGGARIYRMKDNQGRTAANIDTNLVREFERQPGSVHAVAFGPEGKLLAVGGAYPEIRVYNANDGKRIAALKGHEGSIFALVFGPGGETVISGGFDGRLRWHKAATGELAIEIDAAPVLTREKMLEALMAEASGSAVRPAAALTPEQFLQVLRNL